MSAESASASQAPLSDRTATARIVGVVCFTFLCYLTIGIPLPVLPGFVNGELGFGSVLAGAAVSVQYAATLASRPHAGRSAEDILGGIDARKLRSSMTLFLRAAPGETVFKTVLAQFFDGQPDEATDALLAEQDQD